MFSGFFINRPIFAGVIAIVMVLVGALSTLLIPIEQYPSLAPPTVQVSAVYPGADAQTVAASVAAPLEQEVNGVEGMIYLSSVSADDGSYAMTVTFKIGTDIDLAAVQVQNRVAAAESRLPEEVRRQGLVTRKRSPSMLMVLAPHSPDGSYDQTYLSNYATIFMKDALARVPGVGEVTVFGARDYSMRVWLDPDRLAARGLTTIGVLAALQEQNVQVAAGRLGAPPGDDPHGFQYTLRARGRLESPEEFGDVVLRVGADQRLVRLSDVARIELGAQNYDAFAWFNGMPAPVIGIFQLPGSNALDVSRGVRATLARLAADFPPGMECPVFYDFTDFVRASMREVVVTIVVASILVFFTVFLFLQDWRATLIPGIAIPVSIIATLAVLLAGGFSLNMLTLFGLVLAIGIVVDDAIVVVENTVRIMNERDVSAREAALLSMREITGPVIATTLVLLAVFVPTAMLPGITGQLYRQFGVALSVATVISSINALTLSPALCGVLLRRSTRRPNIAFRALDRVIDAGRASYMTAVRFSLRFWWSAAPLLLIMLLASWWMLRVLPTGFIPGEDQSYFFVNVQLPDAAKLERTTDLLADLEHVIRETPGVRGAVTIGGFSLLTGANQSNSGTLIVLLDPWEQRLAPDRAAPAILGTLAARFGDVTGAVVIPFLPPAIQGIGHAGGFDLQIQDRAALGYDTLQQVTADVVQAARESPTVAQPFSGFSASVPQYYVDIDRTKAKRLGVPLNQVFNTLQTQLGSAYVNDFNLFGRIYQVRAQADSRFRRSPTELLNLEVRNEAGQRVPLGTVAEVRPIVGPGVIYRYNLYPAAGVTGFPAPGRSSGETMAAMEALCAEFMPQSFGYEWSGLSYQERAAGNLAPLAFVLAIVFVFLFLAAQYESWSTPLAIMLTIPVGVLGALLATWLRGLDNNVYTQIGLVLLIALVCKNAILIVEFAEQRRRQGEALRDAALNASNLRFRPILMTTLAFVLGTSPLLVAFGAGANSRQAIGTAVFGGMLLGVFLGMFLIPLMYYLVARVLGRSPSSASQTELQKPVS